MAETENPWLSVVEAAAKGVTRLRQINWANPMDHMEITIFDGAPGPWVKLWAPFNLECNGRDPVDLFIGDTPTNNCFQAYAGPLPDSEEYKAEVAKFTGSLARAGEVKHG